MRYFIFILFLSIISRTYTQVVGDITGDEIIDANDYLLLKETLLKGEEDFNPLADFDKDGVQSVRDLVLLYDFLYENGTNITTLDFEEKKDIVTVSFGQFNTKKNSLEIRIRSKELKAFQFDISNMGQIELLKSNPNIYLLNNQIIGFNAKDYFDEELSLNLKLSDGIADEYCFDNLLFTDAVGNKFKTGMGDCANPSWTSAGLNRVKETMAKNDFDALSDIDRNGKVDIKDYVVLFDYLNLNGPTPPGNDVATKNRVKIEFLPAEKVQDYFELVLSSTNEIAAFDLSFYGLEKIKGIDNSEIEDIEFTQNRILWLGNGEQGHKEIRLKVNYEAQTKSKKICMRAPVFLDEKFQYFGVKLGKCYEILEEKIIEPVVVKDKKIKTPKPEKVKKDKATKKIKEKKKKRPKAVKGIKENREELASDERFKETILPQEETDISEKENINTLENSVDKTTTKSKLSELKKIKEIAKKEKKTNLETNHWKNKSTVKILSLNKLQIKTTRASKGQMIFNNEENIFMVFDGVDWKKLAVIPEKSIAQ